MLALLIGTMTAATAFAWGRSHVFVGFNFGFPGYWERPNYAPYPTTTRPGVYPVAVAPGWPPVYVERQRARRPAARHVVLLRTDAR